jgi:hypothetical protein
MRVMKPRVLSSLWAGAVLLALGGAGAGCDGRGLFQKKKGAPDGDIVLPPDSEVTPGGLRRLTRDEYDNTLRDLLGDTTRAGSQRLPEDVTDPFDNDYRDQLSSGVLVETVEVLAEEAAQRALADPLQRGLLVPCTPEGPGDRACLAAFIQSFGRRAFRQPLPAADVERYLALSAHAEATGDFHHGVELVLRAMLQDPRFLYRVEKGAPVAGKPGVFRLSSHEVASRLAYFLWGSTPPDWLLDRADAGILSTAEQLRDAATALLADERAKARVDRFHALWLGYHQLPHAPELTRAMREESGALVQKVVFAQGGDYFDLFRAPQTWADELLAGHYGLPSAGSGAAWVSYGASGRRGILSHGAVLSQGTRFSDTSPTQRGIWVRERLLCQTVPPPPPNANVDEPPPPTTGRNCKKDRYADHANVGSCKSCHQSMDGIGWGLESYDRAGRFRAHDDGEPDCGIDGQGDIPEYGPFEGPAGLSDRLMGSGQLEHCVATQVFRFAHGRRETAMDSPTVDHLVTRWKAEGRAFPELLLAVVTDPTFVFRKEE